MTVTFTQFLLPHGRQVNVTTELPDTCKEQVDLILGSGCRFTVEQLLNGKVSACIEYKDYGDYAVSLTSNGPEVRPGIEKMIMDFKIKEFHEWKSNQE